MYFQEMHMSEILSIGVIYLFFAELMMMGLHL